MRDWLQHRWDGYPEEHAIRAMTWNTPGVKTAIAYGWLKDGTAKRFEVEKRQDAMRRQAIVTDLFKGIACIRHPVSYFAWLTLTEEVRADSVVGEMMSHQISVSTTEPFSAPAQMSHAIRLALGSVGLQILRHALMTDRQVIRTPFQKHGQIGALH